MPINVSVCLHTGRDPAVTKPAGCKTLSVRNTCASWHEQNPLRGARSLTVIAALPGSPRRRHSRGVAAKGLEAGLLLQLLLLLLHCGAGQYWVLLLLLLLQHDIVGESAQTQ